ncbi:hypothetical protein BpHYR1_048388, partial [Brachionus plicatilis]
NFNFVFYFSFYFKNLKQNIDRTENRSINWQRSPYKIIKQIKDEKNTKKDIFTGYEVTYSGDLITVFYEKLREIPHFFKKF